MSKFDLELDDAGSPPRATLERGVSRNGYRRPPRPGARSWRAAPLGFLAVVAALSPSGPARAAEPSVIPIVTISEAGPDKDIPTSGAFYLEGSAPKDVERVYPVFVRISYKPWAIPGASTCESASRALSLKVKKASLGEAPPPPPDKPSKKEGESDDEDSKEDPRDIPFLETRVGVQSIDTLWEQPEGATEKEKEEYASLARWGNAYVPDHWKRAKEDKDKDTRFKIAVSNASYFRPGATYCLLVYRQKKEAKEVKELSELLFRHQVELSKCAKDDKSCRPKINEKYLDAIENLLGPLPAKEEEKLLALIKEQLTDALPILLKLEEVLQTRLNPNNWAGKPHFADASMSWSPPREGFNVRTDYLGRLIAELLSERGDLLRVVTKIEPKPQTKAQTKPQTETQIEYTTRENQDPAKIDTIHLRSDLSAVELVGKKKGKDFSLVLAVPASKLKITGVDFTLEEVLQLARGKMQMASGYKLFAEISKDIVPTADASLTEQERIERLPAEKVKALHERVIRLRKGVIGVCSAANEAKKQAAETTDAARIHATDKMPYDKGTLALAGLFLERSALESESAPASDDKSKKGQKIDCKQYSQQEGPNGLHALEQELDAAVEARGTWDAAKKKLVFKVSHILPPELLTKSTVQMRFTQQAFFDNYVTVFLGRAALVSPTSDIGMSYAGVQVFLWPNPVNEPMWLNRAGDFRRAFALELGVGLEAADFGENNRYSGPGSLPPLFAGLALHVVPYVTFSGGVSLIERRKSALATETRELFPSGYIALTAQINFIGLIRNAFTSSGNGTLEAKR